MNFTQSVENTSLKLLSAMDEGSTFNHLGKLYRKGTYDLVDILNTYGISDYPVSYYTLWNPDNTAVVSDQETAITDHEAVKALDNDPNTSWLFDASEVSNDSFVDLVFTFPEAIDISTLFLVDKYQNIGNWEIEISGSSVASGTGITNAEAISFTSVSSSELTFRVMSALTEGLVGLSTIGIQSRIFNVLTPTATAASAEEGTDVAENAQTDNPSSPTYWRASAADLPITYELTYADSVQFESFRLNDLLENVENFKVEYDVSSAWVEAFTVTDYTSLTEIPFTMASSTKWRITVTSLRNTELRVVGSTTEDFTLSNNILKFTLDSDPTEYTVNLTDGVRSSYSVVDEFISKANTALSDVVFIIPEDISEVLFDISLDMTKASSVTFLDDPDDANAILGIAEGASYSPSYSELRINHLGFAQVVSLVNTLPDLSQFLTVMNAYNFDDNTIEYVDPNTTVEDVPTTIVKQSCGSSSLS